MSNYSEEQLALSKLRLENAESDYASAQIEFEHEHYKAANNRAYYCIFHAIRAVLALESVDYKSHSQLLGHFNKHYIHAGKFDVSHSKIISKANSLRTNSDYNDFFIATKDESAEAVSGAKVFLIAITAYLAEELSPITDESISVQDI
ncbi:MAG: HEPN domain-containing protein [Clostridiales Family XIII bacterium]|nr:HEPN domain-containing protein [Clostridiales Family XIII bacterium]